jgi:hypothetical protein
MKKTSCSNNKFYTYKHTEKPVIKNRLFFDERFIYLHCLIPHGQSPLEAVPTIYC